MDENLPSIPPFRERRDDESESDYRVASLMHSFEISRVRDEWLAGRVAVVSHSVELLRTQLIGDGTILQPGLLPEIKANQNALVRTQKESTELLRGEIKTAISTAAGKRELSMFKTTTRWALGIIASVIAIVAAAHITTGHP